MSAAEVEVDRRDVVRAVLQFLRESGLARAADALEEESGVALNTLEDPARVADAARGGRWDEVLESVAGWRIEEPARLLVVYEQAATELLEAREVEAAAALMETAALFKAARRAAPDRFERLVRLLNAASFDEALAYPRGETKESRREEAAQALLREARGVPPSCLVRALGQAAKWRAYTGQAVPGSAVAFSAPREATENPAAPAAAAAAAKAERDRIASAADERWPGRARKEVRLRARAACVAFSPDGSLLAVGRADGFVDVRDTWTGKVRKDLSWALELVHAAAVTCLSFSRDSQALAVGTAAGGVALWSAATGRCLARLGAAHAGGVSSVEVSPCGSKVLSAGADGVLRVHGTRSDRPLREFRGHDGGVLAVRFSPVGDRVASGGADGTLRVWDARTATGVAVLRPRGRAAVRGVLWRGETLLALTAGSGEVRALAQDGSDAGLAYVAPPPVELVAACLSPRGTYLHAVGADSVLYTFRASSGAVESTVRTHAAEVLALAHHPHRNQLATVAADSTMRLWCPAS